MTKPMKMAFIAFSTSPKKITGIVMCKAIICNIIRCLPDIMDLALTSLLYKPLQIVFSKCHKSMSVRLLQDKIV